MDELELLKKDWKNQDEALPKLSYNEIYKMILKKSSSMVKWIFIISVLEFIVWSSIDIIVRLTGQYEELEVLGLEGFSMFTTILSYGILLYFMIRFYLNYKNIQTTDSAAVLMKNILNTRKTVKQYVWINISFLAITTLVVITYMAFYTDAYTSKSADQEVPIYLVIVTSVIVLAIFIGLLALLYRLIYGILTRRLKKNYKELQKLEV
ncbi:hypothetical protein J8L88_15285 [Aquimarina sp. MMG015]|uniref:hypothetical protein n=1 Tax=unclassified Aquimarina TaxID=2627091 RepID=UPI000E504382|nr:MULTISPECIES: hypothetical protein [unclassified Aquimarina]AXT54241.1 hypothetical protein D1815_00240 [Aquimarina sp. AD1]MBQ4804226.1 hypothetical protein [Aquimarina sp. MMG015]RKN28491.1 hypothetical protein D7035_07925 [Aquimarina sp. AD1]